MAGPVWLPDPAFGRWSVPSSTDLEYSRRVNRILDDYPCYEAYKLRRITAHHIKFETSSELRYYLIHHLHVNFITANVFALTNDSLYQSEQ